MNNKDFQDIQKNHIKQIAFSNGSNKVDMKEKKLNRLLARQIKRKLNPDVELPIEVQNLLESISDSYDHFEKEKQLIERAMELSSKELRASYGKLAVQAELERKNDALQQFVSMASHDLKAPLRTIISFVQLLERNLKGSLDDTSKEYMDFIKSGVRGMDSLIKNLLQQARVNSNQGDIEEISIDEIIEHIQRNLFALCEETNAQIHVDASFPVIKAVRFQLIQLFQNLVGNAIKFRRENVDPVVIISSKTTDSDYLFIIKDNGIGIPQEEQAKVFEVFERLKGAGKYEGSGLGLSICKQIIENLKGKIWLESEVGVGTTFFFSIPIQKDSVSSDTKMDNGISVMTE